MKSNRTTAARTRRSFMGAGAASLAAVGLSRPANAAAKETLAIDGGPPAVSYPANRYSYLTNWPRYGAPKRRPCAT